MANPQTGGAQLVAQDGIKLPVSLAVKPAGNIGLSDRAFFIQLDATTAAFTATMPDPAKTAGQPIVIKKIDSTANAITLGAFASETFDGQASIVLTKQYEAIMLISDGTNWQLIVAPAEILGSLNLTQPVTVGVTPTAILTTTGAANTTITASTEAIDINMALARTLQWSTGALTTQRQFVITAPTLSFVAGSTVTNAVLMEVNGIPIAGTNATITTSTALRVVGTSADLANNRIAIGITGTLSDGGTTSTTQAYGLNISQTINYTAASKTGAYYGIYVNPTNTSLPAGNSGGVVLSTTASGLTGALILHNQTDEITNFEALTLKASSNVWTLNSIKGGTGTVRSIAISTGSTTAVTINSAQLVTTSSGIAANAVATVSALVATGAVQTTGATAVATITAGISTGGAGGILTVTGAASTGQTLSTEINFVNINLAQTVTWATGAITNQRCVFIQAPTLAFAAGSTVTTASTVCISGAPIQGTNATLTNSWALLVSAGGASINGAVQTAGTQPVMQVVGAVNTAGACPILVVTGAASTNQTASTELILVNFNLAQTVQFATGALTTQRCVLFQPPTFNAVAGSTFTRAATVAISGPPVATGNVTITKNPYALLVQAGDVCLAGSGSALATNAITGHTWIPSCAGTPTGVVVGETGAAAIIVDTTGNKIWANVLGTWKGVAIA